MGNFLNVGIDMGSTCTKIALLNMQKELIFTEVRPTGFSSVETADSIWQNLKEHYADWDIRCVATGYGRVSVPYAQKTVTEITCHAKGAFWISGNSELTVIDIGGQDTKVIRVKNGKVEDFLMNDKCSAGTGRFLEIMANSMALTPGEVCELGRSGSSVKISSMCTVFAESEVISLIGRGEKKENIAYAVVNSIADKVISQCRNMVSKEYPVVLTGGLCECEYLREILEQKLGIHIAVYPEGRYAGAIGAALCCEGEE